MPAIAQELKPRPDDAASTNPLTPDMEIARANWNRYEYVQRRGHDCYCRDAKRCDDFYLGGGLQWDPQVKADLEAQGRPASESNEVMGAVNSAIGYQIANRMDVTVLPRGHDGDDQIAKALNLIFKAELDRVKFRWAETQVFGDGMIEQRGYFDLRISGNESMFGEIKLDTPDPMDVIPDPDAKSYDPDDWKDVIVTRWLTIDEIECLYGAKARAALEAWNAPAEPDFGDGTGDDGVERSRFGDSRTSGAYYDTIQDGQILRYRVIDRQHHIDAIQMVAIYPTGEIEPIDEATDEALQVLKNNPKVLLTRRRTRRVRWTVSTRDVPLHDDWSPYKHFTVIPFFPYFRRGRTRGMVDNAISPQETLNKAIAQALHIVNSTANSGWEVEKDSLTNMATEDLESQGAATGLTVEYKKGSTPPKKIEPNQIPSGMVQLIAASRETIKAVTGVNESMLGVGQQDMSGVAIQSRQFAAQQQLALPLDNLARTRHMLASRCLELFQAYYSDPREFRFTEMDAFGRQQTREVQVNQPQPDGSFLNDLTIGKYDIAITAQPMQITFDNSQFEQITTMRAKMGVRIPDSVVVRYSNLADKQEVLSAMESQGQPPADPLTAAKAGTENAKAHKLSVDADVAAANADLLRAEAVQARVTAMYSATHAGAQIAAVPNVAPVADEMLASAGFVDANAPPAIPEPKPMQTTPAPLPSQSTNPLTPPHPAVGADAGIEKPIGAP